MTAQTGDGLAARVADVPYWYHTLELRPGLTTPGHFDLRGVADDLPWPDVRGRRCLDVATFDGFYAFELERRGAGEVVAVDLDDQADLDWLPRGVPDGLERGDEPVGEGFRIAAEALDSDVRRVTGNVYDLDPDTHGTFDVVVCGALLLHLRDPFRALARLSAVCDGQLLSVERVDTLTSLVLRRWPLQRLVARYRTWSVPNARGHREMLHTAGFDVRRAVVRGIPYGEGFRRPAPQTPRERLHRLAQDAGRRLLTGTTAPPFSAVLAHPAPRLTPAPT